MKLSDSQKAELRLAIEKAEGPGQCIYAYRGTGAPACVVGQLLAMRGMPPQTLETLEGSIGALLYPHANVAVQEALVGFDPFLLQRLQNEWDTCEAGDPVAARAKMLALVEAA